ncbi:Tra5 transposase [Candidatus Phytoplasma pini]|uniref:Tra5 transposase n=1 Tax=Candidatus Phytoplasma pini TaxID=267362 RepID=A0A559KJ19_9MOLU|nr:Tra5 transposase [Candidatus Phytoplasma pini]
MKIQQILTKKGFLVGMSRKVTPRDNAVIENFFGQMKSILERRHLFYFKTQRKKLKKSLTNFLLFGIKNGF